jgi:hypothetical protein
MTVIVVMREVNVKFHAVNGGFLLTRNVQVPAVELEFFQLAFELARVHAKVQQRGDKHVAGDAAEKIKVKRLHAKFILATDAHRLTQMEKSYRSQQISVFHLCPSVAKKLIWLAA